MAQVVNARGHHSHVDLPPTSTLWWQMIPAFIKVYWEYTVNGSNVPFGASKLGTGMSEFGREAPDAPPDTGHSARKISSHQTLLDYGNMQRIVRVIGREVPL
jgi:hypothetical protein